MENIKNKFTEFLIEESLYKVFECDYKSFLSFIKNKNSLDCFCKHCKKESVFVLNKSFCVNYENSNFIDVHSKNEDLDLEKLESGEQLYTLQFNCARDNSHKIIFSIFYSEGGFEKIAQMPTYLSVSLRKTEKYENIIGEEYYNEYLKAIEAYDRGINIGAFVYLRRILEMVIFDKFTLNIDSSNISLAEFSKLSFSEKIKCVSYSLPKILVENAEKYNILTTHINKLSEEECFFTFPLLRSAIELILESDLEEIKQAKKREEFASFLNNAIKTKE